MSRQGKVLIFPINNAKLPKPIEVIQWTVISKLRATQLIHKVCLCNLFKQRHTSHHGLHAGTHPDFHSMKLLRKFLQPMYGTLVYRRVT